MTNAIVAFMHTTAAYQAAVAQLLIGEANFVGKQLELPGWKPIHTTNDAKVSVYGPYYGPAGLVETADFEMAFIYGHLWTIERIRRTAGPQKNWPSAEEFQRMKAVVSTNESRILARNWLHAVGVDTNRLEQERVHVANQGRNRMNPPQEPETKMVPTAVHGQKWRLLGKLESFTTDFSVQLRADTLELWDLRIPDTNHFMLRKLVLTNKAELLGPEPPPRKFVHQIFGGPARFNIVVAPSSVEAELVEQMPTRAGMEFKVLRGPTRVRGEKAERLSRLLTEFDSYAWMRSDLCGPEYGVRLRFFQGDKNVEVILCLKCSWMLIDGKKGPKFDFSNAEFVKVLREIFPRDKALEELKLKTEDRAAYIKHIEQELSEHEAKERY